MIEDLNGLADGATLRCDLCIIGSGAAGLGLAKEWIGTKAQVVVLEGGGTAPEAPSQDLYECAISGLPFKGHMCGRNRIYGGTTTTWGGQSLPLDEMDFQQRDWVAQSGWPICRNDLLPYYERAAEHLLTDTLNFDTDLFKLLNFQPPLFDPKLANYHFTKWSPRPSLRDVYGKAIAAAANIRLIFHANLTRIDVNETGDHVVALSASSLQGRKLTVRASHVVLCTGGIETARILLANNSRQKRGIGNDLGLVGRYFQDHPTTTLGRLESDDPRQIQRIFHTFYCGGRKFAPRISLAPEAQRDLRILNISGVVAFNAGANAPYTVLRGAASDLIRRRAGMEAVRGVVRGMIHLPSILPSAWMYFARGRGYTPNPSIEVHVLSEQEPNSDSRVRLIDEVDALGMPRAEIDWRPTELTGRTIRAYGKLLQGEFARLGMGRLKIPEHFSEVEWVRHVGDVNHHMGTTRMSESPQTGVVNAACRIHGLDNLWIASSSVFPTGGHSNPTLTLLALTFRLADELKRRLP